jgi:hypothetical protein
VYEVVIDGQLLEPGLHAMQIAAYILIGIAFIANALPENPADVIAGLMALRQRNNTGDEPSVAMTTGDGGPVSSASSAQCPSRGRTAGAATPIDNARGVRGQEKLGRK